MASDGRVKSQVVMPAGCHVVVGNLRSNIAALSLSQGPGYDAESRPTHRLCCCVVQTTCMQPSSWNFSLPEFGDTTKRQYILRPPVLSIFGVLAPSLPEYGTASYTTPLVAAPRGLHSIISCSSSAQGGRPRLSVLLQMCMFSGCTSRPAHPRLSA